MCYKKNRYHKTHIVVPTETDALLLENNFNQKTLANPRYNVRCFVMIKAILGYVSRKEPFSRIFATNTQNG
jgi:excinuclease ABC subunit C